MHEIFKMNTDIRNRLSNGEILVGETLDENLNNFIKKVVELKPESVYEVAFELGQRLANFHYYGLKNIGGCEFDLLCGTYGQNHFKLYDIPNLYLEFFDRLSEVEPRRNWDLIVFYGNRPEKEIVDKLAQKCKRMLFWTNSQNWELFTPGEKEDKYEGVNFLGPYQHTHNPEQIMEAIGIKPEENLGAGEVTTDNTVDSPNNSFLGDSGIGGNNETKNGE
jgi:hypothetical protein